MFFSGILFSTNFVPECFSITLSILYKHDIYKRLYIWYYDDNLTFYLMLDIYIVSNFCYYKYCYSEYLCI